jgi:hypothetical protein
VGHDVGHRNDKGLSMGQLNVMRIKSLTEPGRYMDGDGLMLKVMPSGARSWILRVSINGQRRDIGLGSLKVMTLAEARQKASDLRRDVARGIDPIAEKKKVEDPVPTFRDAAHRLHAEHKASWKNGKHQAQWISTLETYAFPLFADRPVDQIEGPLIRDALAPIWVTKPETARRVRQRIGAVLDWSYVKVIARARRRCARFPRACRASRARTAILLAWPMLMCRHSLRAFASACPSAASRWKR